MYEDNQRNARRGRGGPGRGPEGRGRGWQAFDRRNRPTTTNAERTEILSWFVGNLTDGWFIAEPEITVDDYEILVVGKLAPIDQPNDGAYDENVAGEARLDRFRDDTRERRIAIARDAEARFARHVSWGASVGSISKLFTTASVPVMTRLRMDQRRTLDTLVEANVARSRSEALAWCVDLVTKHEEDWIVSLRDALDTVTRARRKGRTAHIDPRSEGGLTVLAFVVPVP